MELFASKIDFDDVRNLKKLRSATENVLLVAILRNFRIFFPYLILDNKYQLIQPENWSVSCCLYTIIESMDNLSVTSSLIGQ